MEPIRCKSCRVRLYWADKDDVRDLLCWSCSACENGYIEEEEAKSEVRCMVHEEERREG